MAATRIPVRVAVDELRDKFLTYGLKEEEHSIDGYGFTYHTLPHAAIVSYQVHHDQRVPRRFWFDIDHFILAE